jgi:hypothetical protein
MCKILVLCGKVKHAFGGFMVVPEHIHTERVEPHTLDHLNSMGPVLNRDSGIMELPGYQLILRKVLLSIKLCEKQGLNWSLQEGHIIVGNVRNVRLYIVKQKEVKHSSPNDAKQAAQERATHDNRSAIFHGKLADVKLGVLRPPVFGNLVDVIHLLIALVSSLYNHFVIGALLLLFARKFAVQFKHFAVLYVLSHKHCFYYYLLLILWMV